MRLIDADEVIKYYKNIGKEFPELSVGTHFSIADIISNLDNIHTVKKEKKMTMTNAEWCIRHGITFKNLCCKSCDDSRHECIGYYDKNGNFNKCYVGKRLKSLGDLTSESILAWLDMEHKESILDDAEKRYLKGVIRPFRDRVQYIAKAFADDACVYRINWYIFIHFNDGTDDMKFPVFHKSNMYKGMSTARTYTPEELGI